MRVEGLVACRGGARSCGGTDSHCTSTLPQEGPADAACCASVCRWAVFSVVARRFAWCEKFAQEGFEGI